MRPVARTCSEITRKPRLTVLGWHRVDPIRGDVCTSLEVFCGHLDVLAEWGAVVLPLADAVAALVAGQLPKRAVALTFDDGYASVLEIAWPLLCERGWPATLFVVSGYLDGARRLPWDEQRSGDSRSRLLDRRGVLDAAAAGIAIGSHTVEHRWLPHLGDTELDRELRRSRDTLEDLLGNSVRALAYPMGGWDRRVRAAAARTGYANAVTTDRGSNAPRQHLLSLRRTIAPGTVHDLALALDGAYTWLRPVDRWRTRAGPLRTWQ